MASSAPQNFKYHSGPALKEISRLATDSKTWVAGQPYKYAAAGTVEPCATDDVTIKGIFAADQSASTSSSTVTVLEIVDSATRFIGYVSSDASDAAAAATDRDGIYGIQVDGTVSTVNKNETTAVAVKVVDLYHDVETGKAAVADSPGRVIFRVLAAALDA